MTFMERLSDAIVDTNNCREMTSCSFHGADMIYNQVLSNVSEPLPDIMFFQILQLKRRQLRCSYNVFSNGPLPDIMHNSKFLKFLLGVLVNYELLLLPKYFVSCLPKLKHFSKRCRDLIQDKSMCAAYKFDFYHHYKFHCEEAT